MSEDQKLFILTRTSGRKYFFHQNYSSISDARGAQVVQIVSYDDQETAKYVKQYADLEEEGFRVVEVEKEKKNGGGHFPYNLYLNQMMESLISQGESGWILVLDDDDLMIEDPRVVLEELSKLDGRSQFLLWVVEFPGGRLVPKKIGNQRGIPKMGEVSMIGFAFHLEAIREHYDLRFSDRKGGDYLMVRQLAQYLKPVWVDQIWTKINYDSIRRSGSGKRNDLKPNYAQIEDYNLFWDNKMEEKKKIKLKPKKASLVIEDDDELEFVEDFRVEREDVEADLEQEEEHEEEEADGEQDEEADGEQDEEADEQEEADEEEEADEQEEADVEQPNREEKDTNQVNQEPDRRITLSDGSNGVFRLERGAPSEKKVRFSVDDQITLPRAEDEQQILHPQLEQLLDLLSDDRRVQFVNAQDLREVLAPIIREEVSNAVHQALGKEKLVVQPNQNKRVRVEKKVEPEDSLESQLESLVNHKEEEKLSRLLDNYAKTGGDEDQKLVLCRDTEEAVVDFDQVDDFVEKVFILNYNSKASDLQYKLEQIGFTQVQVVEANKKRDFWMNLLEIAKMAEKRKLKRFIVIRDQVHLNREFAQEFLFNLEKMKTKDWKLVVLGAVQNLAFKSSCDWNYYLNTYPDLKKAKPPITNESQATRHWKLNGQKERRYGLRGMVHPDALAGVCAVMIGNKFYKDLSKLQKARNQREFIMKNYRSSVFTLCPLLAIPEVDRVVKMRNRHNLVMYDLPHEV